MIDRTHDEILDEMVHAVACVVSHYGPNLNAAGLAWVRERLDFCWYTDASFRLDMEEDDPYIDFHQRITWPDGWDQFDTLQTGREA
jgi:hypothetical protein